MSQENVQKCIQAMQLSDTVLSGAQYLKDSADAAELMQNFRYAVTSVNQVVSLVTDKKENSLSVLSGKLLRLLDKEQEDGQALINATNQWRNFVYFSIGTYLKNVLPQLPYLSSDACETLFALIEDAPLETAFQSVLFVWTACLCGFTQPERSYQYMMKAFEQTPTVVQLEAAGREKYSYAPTPQHFFTSCPVCGAKGVPWFNAFSFCITNFAPPFEPAKLWMKCSTCETIYASRFPEFYLKEKPTPHKVLPNANYWNVFTDSIRALPIWSGILNELQNYTNRKNMLEVGIGDGQLIATALEMGYTVESIEILEEEAQKVADLLNIEIWCCDFLDYQTDHRYAVITMGDVIEHTFDPKAALLKAYELLEDEGVLWLSTPNYESSFSRLYKFKDPMWMETWHVTYFCFRGFEQLAKQCGFEVRKYSVSSRYNGSMELILTKIKD